LYDALFREFRRAGKLSGEAKTYNSLVITLRRVNIENGNNVLCDRLFMGNNRRTGWCAQVGAEPKIPGIIMDEQSKIRPFSVVAR
jgi:hypothetical protein